MPFVETRMMQTEIEKNNGQPQAGNQRLQSPPDATPVHTAQTQPQAVHNPAETESVLITGHVLGFLTSEPGQELAKQIVDFFKDWKNQAVRVETRSSIIKNGFQLLTLGLVLGVAVYVSSTGKMEPVIARFLETVAGYALGKKTVKCNRSRLSCEGQPLLLVCA